jgi:hypothetical protein
VTVDQRPRKAPGARRWAGRAALLATAGALLAAGSATAYGSVIGQEKPAPVRTPHLEVDDVHLSLAPGGSADLVVRVRNRGTVPVTADRITLESPLRDARPKKCTDRVSGPLLAHDGLILGGRQRVTVRPGTREWITVPGAVRLSRTAKGGCGFRVVMDVRAVPVPPKSPAVTPTTEGPVAPKPPTGPAPTSTEDTGSPQPGPTTTPPTAPTTSTTGTFGPLPPPIDCDEFDPTCN